MPEREGDPALAIHEKKPKCDKTCGSKGCKGDIKKDRCAGIPAHRCVSQVEKTQTDRLAANATLGDGPVNREWLNDHGKLVPSSHLSSTASLARSRA